MDTSQSKCMTVHMHDGSKIHFTPSNHGLNKHKLGTNESEDDIGKGRKLQMSSSFLSYC
jgi:hypothetical protein